MAHRPSLSTLPMLGVLFTAAAPSLNGQAETARYRAQPDTVWTEFIDATFVSYIRDADTVEMAGFSGYGLRRASWTGGEPLRVQVQEASGFEASYEISPRGLVLKRNGTPVRGSLGYDPLPLPEDGRLDLGRVWTDSLRGDTTAEGAPIHSVRSYRVDRIVDTLGTRVAIVESAGTTNYHATFPSGAYNSLVLAGPFQATYWFDVRGGRLLAEIVTSDLAGSMEHMGRGNGPEVFAARMRSQSTSRTIGRERAVRLRRLAGADRSFSSAEPKPEQWIHQSELHGDTLDSVLLHSRTQRMVLARTVYRDGRVLRHSWEENSPSGDRVLHLAAPGEAAAGASPLSPPSGVAAWAVADSAMEEHLVPVLLTLPRDGRPHPVAIYCPSTERWARVLVRLVDTWGGTTNVVISGADGEVRQVLGATSSHVLYFSVTAEPGRRRIRGDWTSARSAENLLSPGARKPQR